MATLAACAGAAWAQDVSLRVELLDPATGKVVATTATTADGSFAFENVAPGRYLVRPTGSSSARAENHNSSRSNVATRSAENHNSSRSNVATRVAKGWAFVDMSAGASVSGHAGDGMAITLGPSGGAIKGRVAIKEEGLEAR